MSLFRRLRTPVAVLAIALGILTLAGCDLPRDNGGGYDSGSSGGGGGGHHH